MTDDELRAEVERLKLLLSAQEDFRWAMLCAAMLFGMLGGVQTALLCGAP